MRPVKRLLRYTVIFEEALEGGYVVRIPALGCVTEGETFEEARALARDAIRAYCMSLLKHGEPIPTDSPTEIVSAVTVPLTVTAK